MGAASHVSAVVRGGAAGAFDGRRRLEFASRVLGCIGVGAVHIIAPAAAADGLSRTLNSGASIYTTHMNFGTHRSG